MGNLGEQFYVPNVVSPIWVEPLWVVLDSAPQCDPILIWILTRTHNMQCVRSYMCCDLKHPRSAHCIIVYFVCVNHFETSSAR